MEKVSAIISIKENFLLKDEPRDEPYRLIEFHAIEFFNSFTDDTESISVNYNEKKLPLEILSIEPYKETKYPDGLLEKHQYKRRNEMTCNFVISSEEYKNFIEMPLENLYTFLRNKALPIVKANMKTFNSFKYLPELYSIAEGVEPTISINIMEDTNLKRVEYFNKHEGEL